MTARSRKRKRGMSFQEVSAIALELPGVEPGTSYGTPAFRVGRKFLVRLREDGETLAVRIDFDERDILIAADPEAFFITEHYRNYPAVVVRLAAVDPDSLRQVLAQAWRQIAPKRLVAEHDAR